ncbi:MAG: sugar ABC transporter permease [Chloroflexi bacterium]|nr:sugar ABC transporter permease [Chloroflexota bacterium]
MSSIRRLLSYNTGVRLILGGYLVGVGLLLFVPAVLSFALAFFQYDSLSPPRWMGTLNFMLVYSDELFRLSIQNALALIILPVPLRVFGALLVARLMQRESRFIGWFRAAVYLPNTIPVAAFAVAGLWIFNPLYGPVNLLLTAVGLAPPAWFVDPLWAKPALILLTFWSIGEGFLVCLAALQDIPAEVSDAAKVDGAGPLTTFVTITLPLVAPTLALLAFRDIILTLQNAFVTITLTTGGGPYYATFTLPLFIHEQAFDLLAFGVAGAGLWVLYVLTGLLVIGLYYIVRAWDIGITDETFIV